MNIPARPVKQMKLVPTSAAKWYAQVVFNLPLRDPFTYEIPPALEGKLAEGMRVLVPFGPRKLTGYVVGFTDKVDEDIKIKPVADILDPYPVLSPEVLSLTQWVAGYYQSSWGEAIKAALPAGLDEESRENLAITEKGQEALQKKSLSVNALLILEMVNKKGKASSKQLRHQLKNKFKAHTLTRLKLDGHLTAEISITKSTVGYQYEKVAQIKDPKGDREKIEKLLARSRKQKLIYQLLLEKSRPVKELAKEVPAYSGPLRELKKKGLVEIQSVKVHRNGTSGGVEDDWSAEPPQKLTSDQEKVFQNLCGFIDTNKFHTCLLNGVTGSGKTEIYIQCIERALKHGKSAIMMVPEISLTPQTVNLFQKRFGDRVAILHSGLSNTERFLEWKKIHDGKVSIVVGARSAVFAPFKNPGVIVIDEEHDPSYKQDSTPRYHARDTAIVRARNQNAVVILGSATPSMESRRNAELGKYSYLTLEKRIGDRLMPHVSITDMKKEREDRKNFSIFSVELIKAIRERLEHKEQVFLFLNRRGTASYVFCKDCGFVFDCPRCSVTLTFHGNERSMRCHYCNHSARVPQSCADCSGEVIRFSGFGTQRLEEETHRLFSSARIMRLDRDTTRKRLAFESMYQKMKAGEIDILIGTQMITKGHDFPNVTLVGVVNADLSLNIPDFRSCERSFQLLTQVGGRAGRGKVPGKVIIQTFNPKHYVFDLVRHHDYENFYKKEIKLRERLNFPPLTRLTTLEVESGIEGEGEKLARRAKNAIAEKIKKQKGVELLGPARAALYRINNKFRWHMILRSPDVRPLQDIINDCPVFQELRKTASGKARLFIDVDPVNML